MRSVVYDTTGPSSVLRILERDALEPAPGQVRVRMAVAGINPTDWKSRAGSRRIEAGVPVSTGQDGAGTIDAVGEGVTRFAIGDRVWLWDVADRSSNGTAQESVTVADEHVMPLPAGESFDTGASLGIPALTAHLALAAHLPEGTALGPGVLAGQPVLVTGGAGAVGHAAIQLARWAGATVITTISGDAKATLADAAGAHHIINYRDESVPDAVRAIAPDGVPLIVDVALGHNADDDTKALARGGTIASYADDNADVAPIPLRFAMGLNARVRFILTYTAGEAEKRAALEGVQAALEAGALRVGEDHGMPLTRFPLDETAAAHDAVEAGTIGKVLIDIGPAE